MTTKVEDNQISSEVMRDPTPYVKSISSTTLVITDDGKGNIVISAPDYVESV